jgi:competence protein ComEC
MDIGKARIFLYFCIFFIGGIALNSLFSVSLLFQLGFLIFAIFLISVFRGNKKTVFLGFCILLLLAGIWRHQQALSEVSYSEMENAVFIGIVVAEPDVREDSIKLTVEPVENLIKGKVLVTVESRSEYQYGDRLEIKGSLKVPFEFEDFNYKDYLLKEGIYSVSYYPEISLLERGEGNPLFEAILRFKSKLRGSIYQNLSPPHSSILGAVILGDKSRMSLELKEKLNAAGVRHITAVSGMHVAIISSILMSFLAGFSFLKKQAFFISIILIAAFVILTGLQPSAVRAGIMGSLFLLCRQAGRPRSFLNALMLAAVLMLAVNPFLLKSDVGFQMSFLAMLGIIYFLPFFRKCFQRILGKAGETGGLKDILGITFAAQIFTLPVLIYNFGYVSLVSPLTNALIIPILPFLMASGFIFGMAGIFFQSLGWILSLPSWMLLSYVLKTIDFFSRLPFSYIAVPNVHWLWLFGFYLFLGFFAWRLNRKENLLFYRLP